MEMEMLKAEVFRAFSGAALLMAAGLAHATTVVDLSGGTQWRTTTDQLLGNQWAIGNFSPTDGVAATAPYPNDDTTSLNENRMMWNCGADGSSCSFDSFGNAEGDGPVEAFFGTSFFIKPGHTIIGAEIGIIADDFFDLVVNGSSVLTDILENNQDAAGQPVPILFDLAPFLQAGDNTLAIRAMDGFLIDSSPCFAQATTSTNLGPFCNVNRGNEYLYISGSVQHVPAPPILLLFGGGLLALQVGKRLTKART